MTRNEIRAKEELLNKYNIAYYQNNESLVSDEVYDKLYKEVEQWYIDNNEDNFGPTSKVGSSIGDSSTRFVKVKHNKRMLSLANSYSINEVKEFLNRYNIKNWVAEQKMDGLSLSLWYEYGNLVRAVTRGDGTVGEDVTESAKEIRNIPKSISFISKLPFVEIRGEVLIPKDKFKEINKQQLERDLPTFATSRNLASGTLRQLDTSLVKERGLRFVAYYILNTTDHDIYSYIKERTTSEGGDFISGKYQSEMLELLRDYLIFDVPEYVVNENIDYSIKVLNNNETYDTDGVVFKNNNINEWTEETAKTPKWAFAYKYPTEQVETKLLGVTWQVGRTGKITPVAELEPVTISGTVVSRATLHNMNEINRKDIRINDYVIVEKAAEIIPQVVCPVVSKRTVDCYVITAPEICPECGGRLVTRDSNLYCISNNCRSKLIESLSYFADRVNMNIQGLGRSTVEKLVDAGLLTDIASIYELKDHRTALLSIDKLSEKSVDNLLAEIENSRKNSFGKLLGSLGIETIGRSAGQALAAKYPTWEELLRASTNEFVEVKGIGRSSALAVWNFVIKLNASNEIRAFLDNKKKITLADIVNDNCKRIIDLHIGENSSQSSSDKLKDKTFGFTGKLPVSRNIITDEITNNGGTYSGTIGKKLDYMIVGLNPTAHKIKTAKELGIKMLSYEDFRKLID